MTPAEARAKVLAVYPDAGSVAPAWRVANAYEIWAMRGYAPSMVGSGTTRRAAWLDAARRLEGTP